MVLDSREVPLEESTRVTFLVQGRLRPNNPPLVFIRDPAGREVRVKGRAIHDAIFDVTQEKHPIVGAVLLNTTGGYVDVGLPVLANVAYLRHLGYRTHAFVDRLAGSYGGEIFFTAEERTVFRGSKVHRHQTYKVLDKGVLREKGLVPEAVWPAEDPLLFRKQLLECLGNEVLPQARAEAIAHVQRAFDTPGNFLDDVYFKGHQLDRFGLARVVTNPRALAQRYEEYIGTPRNGWPPEVQAFFRPNVRNACARSPLDISYGDECSWG